MAETLANLRTRIRQRTDTENSGFVTDAELTQLINTAYKELYGLLVRKSLQRAESVETITADGSESYDLPDDFLGLIGVYRNWGEHTTPLERFPDKFRPGTREGDALMYRLVNESIVLYPRPSGGTYDLVYIPVPEDLSVDTDTLEGVLGWEEFVVIDAAINVLAKEESDTRMLEMKRARILQRIEDEANVVEFTETPRILNVNETWRRPVDPASADRLVPADIDEWGF
jgi:hypothetical protein